MKTLIHPPIPVVLVFSSEYLGLLKVFLTHMEPTKVSCCVFIECTVSCLLFMWNNFFLHYFHHCQPLKSQNAVILQLGASPSCTSPLAAMFTCWLLHTV